jgi:hypothetical protein
MRSLNYGPMSKLLCGTIEFTRIYLSDDSAVLTTGCRSTFGLIGDTRDNRFLGRNTRIFPSITCFEHYLRTHVS